MVTFNANRSAVAAILLAVCASNAPVSAAADDLLLCQDSLQPLRDEQRSAAVAFHSYARPERAFPLGVDNPQLETRMRAVVDSIFKAKRHKAPPWELRCRTWACRLVVREIDGEPNGDWLGALQADPTVKSIGRGFGLRPRLPIASDRQGIYASEHTLFIKVDGAKANPSVEPKTVAACESARQTLLAEIAVMKLGGEKDVPRYARFFEFPANPPLTTDVGAQIRRVLGPDNKISVMCRGNICRLLPPPATPQDYGFSEILDHDDQFRHRFGGGSCCLKGRYLELADPNRIAGGTVIDRFLDDMGREQVLQKCYRMYPASGNLELRLRLPATGESNDDGAENKLSARAGGFLGDSFLAACVLRAVNRRAATLPLPAMVSGGLVYKRWDFPLRPDPRDL